jgi:hypothetical protein
VNASGSRRSASFFAKSRAAESKPGLKTMPVFAALREPMKVGPNQTSSGVGSMGPPWP